MSISHFKSKEVMRLLAITLICTMLWSGVAWGVLILPPPDTPPDMDPLSFTPVLDPPNLVEFVKSKPAAIKLGKAFFWDMQVGSDGIVGHHTVCQPRFPGDRATG